MVSVLRCGRLCHSVAAPGRRPAAGAGGHSADGAEAASLGALGGLLVSWRGCGPHGGREVDSQQGKESGPGPRSGGDKGVGGCGLADEGLPRAWVRSAPGLAPLCPGPGSALQSRPPARLAPVLGQPLRAPSRSLRGGCPFREELATELGETADPWEGGRSEGQQPWAVQVWGGGAGSKQLAVGLEDKRLAHRVQ